MVQLPGPLPTSKSSAMTDQMAFIASSSSRTPVGKIVVINVVKVGMLRPTASTLPRVEATLYSEWLFLHCYLFGSFALQDFSRLQTQIGQHTGAVWLSYCPSSGHISDSHCYTGFRRSHCLSCSKKTTQVLDLGANDNMTSDCHFFPSSIVSGFRCQ